MIYYLCNVHFVNRRFNYIHTTLYIELKISIEQGNLEGGRWAEKNGGGVERGEHNSKARMPKRSDKNKVVCFSFLLPKWRQSVSKLVSSVSMIEWVCKGKDGL